MNPSKIRAMQIIGAMLALAGLIISLTPKVTASRNDDAQGRQTSVEARTLSANKSAKQMRLSETYGRLPLSFEQNQGQADRQVKFLSRGANYTVLLTPAKALLRLRKTEANDEQVSTRADKGKKTRQIDLSLSFIGANRAARITGEDRLEGKSNYLIGNDRKKWHTNIPHFSRVRYHDVYPGIDAVYYGTNQRQLEYDLIVAPGADPDLIRISFEGVDKLSIDTAGNLVLATGGGEITQKSPAIYQESENGKETVAGHYVINGEREVGIEVGEYDRTRPLTIDPQLLYATFYGGSNQDIGNDIAVDSNGNAYVTGETNSDDLLLISPFQGTLNPAGTSPTLTDAFVTKLNGNGTDIVYSTYLGGDLTDEANAIAVTNDGKACVTGETFDGGHNFDPHGAHNFPTTSSRFQGGDVVSRNRSSDAFVTVLSVDGSSLFYSTYFGGSAPISNLDAKDIGFGIAVDSSGKVYVTGESECSDFPTKNAYQNSRGGGFDAFIAKFDPNQSGNSSLVYSTFLGGTGTELGNDIAVTSSGVAVVIGVTGSFNFPTRSPSSLPPFQASQGGVNDGFIAKFSSSGALIYSTYFGGSDADAPQAVAVDSSERAYVTGKTRSSNFPLKNAFNSIGSSSNDVFVAKFNADGTALFYSSFLTSVSSSGHGIAIDEAGNAYVTGSAAANLASVNGFPPSVPSGNAMVAKIEPSDATGTTTPNVLYIDTFGGVGADGSGIAVDPRGNVYITGRAPSNFATTPGAFEETFRGGDSDAFVVKIGSTFNDTIGVFRPSTGQMLLRNSNTSGNADLTISFGTSGDKPVAGDWNGDGQDETGVFRPSTGQFILRKSNCTVACASSVSGSIFLNFGQSGDLPVVGDWNGDGIDTVGVFRNGTFLLSNSSNISNTSPVVDLNFGFGAAGDTPVAGDWNGDGIDSIGVKAAGTNTFALRNSNSSGPADVSFNFGDPSDLPYFGDWNGDGIDTVGVFRNGTAFLRNTNSGGNGDLFLNFGQTGDLPVAGDWNGRPDPFTPPNGGINDPNTGASSVGQLQTFTTSCSDPDGWHDLATIDFKIARSDGKGKGVPIALWVQFNENTGRVSFYDPDTQTWSEGEPGTNAVLSSRFAELHLASTVVVGSGPTGTNVQIMWAIVFKDASIMNDYKQYLKITDDAGLTTGFDKVGSWSVR